MLVDFKKPPYVVLDGVVSYTGKYYGFLGTHFEKGIICYVVGAINKQDGSTTCRHYNEHNGCVNPEHAKSSATKTWNDLRAGLVAKPRNPDESGSAELTQWFEVYERRIRERARKLPLPN